MRVKSAASVAQHTGTKVWWFAAHAVLAIGLLLIAHPARAQVCEDEFASSSSSSESASDSSNSRFSMKCDMTYKNTELMCDKNTVYPSCPPEPMPMKDTPLKSFIKDFSPYLWTYARDPDDKTRPYSGQYAIGTPGDPQRAQQMASVPAKGLNPQKSCENRIKFPEEPETVEDEAKMKRLEVDNCTNEYILDSAQYPYQKENATLLSMEDPNDRSKRINLSTQCQPLKTATETKNEYLASDYLKAAWMKTLQDPKYRKTKGAKGEPHLPDNVEITNKVSWCGSDGNDTSCPFPEVRLSSIGSVPYEEINDPTHPFSPRWDYKNNERDEFSPKVEKAGYQSETDPAVYCAGVKEAEDSEEGKSKEDQTVKVDILEFRRPAFQKAMNERIKYNKKCFEDRNTGDSTVPIAPYPYVAPIHPEFLAMKAGAYCYKINAPFIPATPYDPGYEGEAERVPCWECFGHDEGEQVDDDEELPPCATRYDSKDQSFSDPEYIGGKKNFGSTMAVCSSDGHYHAEYDIQTICRDLRAPVTMINKLKMRYHNPDEKENIVLKEGVQEGLSFKPYFGNHMPYPRLWDTGRSIQEKNDTEQDAKDTHGQYTAIVGVGHEATPGDSEDEEGDAAGGEGDGGDDRQAKADKLKKQDLRCLYGGWGDDQNFGGVSVKLPDPISSWTEFKLYQTRARRELKLSCVPRYEKYYKLGSTENQLLARLGARFAVGVISTADENGNFTHETLAEHKEKESEEDGADAGDGEDKPVTTSQMLGKGWPLAWRGYLSAKKEDQRFPKFGGDGAVKTGLDNVEPKDIIILENGGANESSGEKDKDGDAKKAKPGLPRLAIVVRTNLPKNGNCADHKDCYVFVEEFNNGKWPDVCGSTDTWGQRKERTYYKPGMLPKNATDEFKRIGTSSSCDNVSLNTCELGPWDKVKFYRPKDDVREGTADKQEEEGGTP